MEQQTQIKGDVNYMKVKCIKSVEGQLTKNRIYVINNENSTYFNVTNDLGNIAPYYKHRFEKVEEDMKKSDLKDGMVVRQRDNSMALVLNGCFMEKGSMMQIEEYDESLIEIEGDGDYDIMEVYTTSGNRLSELFKEGNLTSIWKRQEKSPQELELEELEKQQREIADRMKQVRESMVK